MTKEQLYEAMGLIDDKYIAESMTKYKPKMPRWVKHSIATAAVLVICVGIALFTLGGAFGRKDAVNLGGNMSGSSPSNPGDVFDGDCGNAPEDNWTGDDSNEAGTVGIRIGDVVGSVTTVTVESYGAGVLTLGVNNYYEGAVGVLVLYEIGGVASYSAFGVDTSDEGLSSVTGAREDRSELIRSVLDVTSGEGRLVIDMTDVVSALTGKQQIILFVDGESYRLYA